MPAVKIEHPVLDDPMALAVAEAILTGTSILSAEKTPEWQALGLNRRRADRIKKRPEVIAYVAEMREDVSIRLANRLLSAAGPAIRTLAELLDPKHAPNIRRMAAKDILEYHFRAEAIKAARRAAGEHIPEAEVEVVDQVLGGAPEDALLELAARLRRAIPEDNRS